MCVSDWSFFLWKVFLMCSPSDDYWLHIGKGTFWIHSYVTNFKDLHTYTLSLHTDTGTLIHPLIKALSFYLLSCIIYLKKCISVWQA